MLKPVSATKNGCAPEWNISLKNDHGASGRKAENNAINGCVVFCGGLLVVSGRSEERPKEKGADCGHALWLCASTDHSSGVSAFALRRWRRFISPLIEVTINCDVLSPCSFTSSIPSTTSCGTLDLRDCDLAFVVPVAIVSPPCNRWSTVYTKKFMLKELTWATPLKYSGPHLEFFKFKNGNDKQHYQHIDRSPVHAFGHQHWRYSYGVDGRRKYSISNRDKGAFQGVMCTSGHADWQGIKTAKPGSVGALNRASDHNQTVR